MYTGEVTGWRRVVKLAKAFRPPSEGDRELHLRAAGNSNGT